MLALLGAGCPEPGDPFVPANDTRSDLRDTPTAPDAEGDTPAGADVPDAAASSLVCLGAPKLDAPFPAHGIGVRIVEPTGLPGVLYAGGTLVLGGRAFGSIDALSWRLGNKTGKIQPIGFFWQAAVPLDAGDNRIVVTATGPNGLIATDEIVVSAFPSPQVALLGALSLEVTPDHVYAGETHHLRASLFLGEANVTAVELVVVDRDGDDVTPKDAGPMVDDGDQSAAERCDEIAGDRVFSACKEITKVQPGALYLRARVTVPGYDGVVETPIQRVDVLERLPVASCLAMKQGLADARQAYGDAGDHSVGLQAALSALVAATGGASGAEAGLAADGYGVWVRFGNGVLGAVPLGAPEGSRGAPFGGLAGGNTIGSRRVTLLEATAGPTEVARAAELLNDGTCPPFAPDGPHAGAGVTLDRLGALPGQGVLVFAGHGGVYFDGLAPHYGWRYQGPQEVLWSGEAVACDRILDHLVACQATGECPAGSACVRAAGGGHPGTCVSRVAADLLRGRVVLGPDTYGITPAFVDHYGGGRMENALVYAGACHSLYNGSLAMAFFGAGASTFVGYTGLTGAAFARQVGEHLLEGMAIDKKPAGEAMCEATDPANPETRAALVGNVGLSLDLAGLLNGSFDLPRLDGWTAEGDARRVLSFCGAKPTQGNFMALISTGLGFAEASGRLSQRFCIPAGATELSFWWRYYSAELEQSCGVPGFQDTWSVRLKTDAGTLPVTVLECRVDDMCHYEANFCKPNPCAPPSDCGCGACYEPYAPATACTFDGAQVMAGAFRKTTVNVSALAGKGPVSLVLEITDKGQPSNETAILIDDVQIR